MAASESSWATKLQPWSVLLVSCALVVLGLPGHAFADQPQLLSVDPASGPAGSKVIVRGTGWTPEYYSSGVRISFDQNHGNGVLIPYADEMVVTPNPDGEFSFETTIPPTFAVGDVVSFSGLIGNGSGARANYTVTAGVSPGGGDGSKPDLKPAGISFDRSIPVGVNIHFDGTVTNSGD